MRLATSIGTLTAMATGRTSRARTTAPNAARLPVLESGLATGARWCPPGAPVPALEDDAQPTTTATAGETARAPRDRLLRSQEVSTRTGLSRTTLWRLERAGEFPKRVRRVGRTIAWRESDVSAWIASRGTQRA